MKAQERWRRAKLETILARHTASEWRALADLDHAGFEFECIEDAYAELKKFRGQQEFTAAQIDAAVRAANNRKKAS